MMPVIRLTDFPGPQNSVALRERPPHQSDEIMAKVQYGTTRRGLPSAPVVLY